MTKNNYKPSPLSDSQGRGCTYHVKAQASKYNMPKPKFHKFPATTVSVRVNSDQTDLADEKHDSIVAITPIEPPPGGSDQQVSVAQSDHADEQPCMPDSPLLVADVVRAAIEKCVEVGPSFFKGVSQTAIALKPAYILYLYMITGGNAVMDAVMAHPKFQSRTRAPCRDKPALMSVQLLASPKTHRQAKWCSEWSNCIIEAGQKGIPPDGFADWAADVTLKECREAVRKRREAEKLSSQIEASCHDSEEAIDLKVENDQTENVAKTTNSFRLEIILIRRENTEVTHAFDLSKNGYENAYKALRSQLAIWEVQDAFAAISHAIKCAELEQDGSDEFRF